MIENEKLRTFRDLVTENPNEDLVALAKLAGYVNAKQAVERIKAADAKAAQQELEAEADKKQGVTPDRALATRTLRMLAKHGNNSARVQAAKALLEAEPKPLTANSQILVVFRGVELDPRQELIADVDPAALAAAIEHVKAEREAAHEQQIQDHAHKYAIDPDEMQLAWELWQHQEARAAGLRVLVLSDATPPANYSRANLDCQVKSVVGQQSPILTGQVEQLVALESEVTTISTDSQLSP